MDLVEQQFLQVVDGSVDRSGFIDIQKLKNWEDEESGSSRPEGRMRCGGSHRRSGFLEALDSIEAVAFDVASLLSGPPPSHAELGPVDHSWAATCHNCRFKSGSDTGSLPPSPGTHFEAHSTFHGSDDEEDSPKDGPNPRQPGRLSGACPEGLSAPSPLSQPWRAVEAAVMPSFLQSSLEEAVAWVLKSKKE